MPFAALMLLAALYNRIKVCGTIVKLDGFENITQN
jgi:hypothetical protein